LVSFVNQTNLNVKLSKNLRGQAGGHPKIWEEMAHLAPP